MSLRAIIKELCRRYQIKPLRRRGQNFLINHNVLNKILEAAELEKDDFVLEIGSGFGFLTEEIAKRAKKVIAIEIDQRFVEILKERLQDYKNIEIVQGDILDPKIDSYIRLSALSSTLRLGLEESSRPKGKRFALGPSPTDRSSIESDSWVIDLGSMDRNGSRIIRSRFKIVANLPYNITGAVLRKFLSAKPRPDLMVLMLQKEVAERICSRPPRMSLLSVLVQFYSQPKIISRVSKESFWPKPKVESAIVKILIKNNPPQIDEGRFFSLLRTGFQQPRKYLLNNLIKSATIKESKDQLREILSYLDKDPKVRPSELSVEDWIELFKKLNSLICTNMTTNFTNNYL